MKLLRDIPPIRSMPYAVDASLYNHVRLSLLRFSNPLELELEGLGVDMVLDNTCWVGYHCYQVSMPLIGWDGFDTNRSSLDKPVECTLHFYHQHAWLQMPRITLALDEILQELLLAK